MSIGGNGCEVRAAGSAADGQERLDVWVLRFDSSQIAQAAFDPVKVNLSVCVFVGELDKGLVKHHFVG